MKIWPLLLGARRLAALNAQRFKASLLRRRVAAASADAPWSLFTNAFAGS